MPDSPLLTIAVPTFNRIANLRLLLTSLAPEIAAHPEVELLVSDNASPDGTPEMVAELIRDGLRCRYLRNPVDLDADHNFLQCYREAAGRYVWIFGDDDILFPGALSRVLRLLAEHQPDLVYVAPFGFEREPEERRRANVAARAFLFTSAGSFVHSVNLRGDLILITAVIVDKHRVEQHPHPAFEEGTGTNLLQLGWTFTALRHLRSGIVVEPGLYAVCELNPRRMFDVIRVFGVNWATAVRRFVGPSRLAETLLREQLYSWFVTNWYGMRRRPELCLIRDPMGQMRPVYGSRPLFWAVAWPLLCWPMLPAGLWLAVLRFVRHADRALNRLRQHPLPSTPGDASPSRATL